MNCQILQKVPKTDPRLSHPLFWSGRPTSSTLRPNLALAVNRQPWLPPGTRRAPCQRREWYKRERTLLAEHRSRHAYTDADFQFSLPAQPFIWNLALSVKCARSFCIDRCASDLSQPQLEISSKNHPTQKMQNCTNRYIH